MVSCIGCLRFGFRNLKLDAQLNDQFSCITLHVFPLTVFPTEFYAAVRENALYLLHVSLCKIRSF